MTRQIQCPVCGGHGFTTQFNTTENSVSVSNERCLHCDGTGKREALVTEADRIRAMNNEELADFFFESPEIEFGVCEYCTYFGGYTSDTPCKHDMGRCFMPAKNEAFKKWLRQPAKEKRDET